MIISSIRKNKNFKKLVNAIDKKDIYKNNLKNLNYYTIDKNSSSSKNKNELKSEINLKKEGIFNLSFPYQENEIKKNLAPSQKNEKFYNFQVINSSRLNTERTNYDKLKKNIKTVIKKGNIPLYQKFTINSNENKYQNFKNNNCSNNTFINKVIKNNKTTSFNVYNINKSSKSKNIINIENNSIKNIKSKYTFVKNISMRKEKSNMSYRQIKNNKNLFENNLSRIAKASEKKSSSNSKRKKKLQSSIQKIRENAEVLENNTCFKKINKHHIGNKNRKIHDLKNNSNKSNENNNNINFSININLNLNQIKNQKQRSTTGEQNKKYKKIIKSLRGIKLDLKKIHQTYNAISLTNSERNNNEKIKQELKNNYFKSSKNNINTINHQNNRKKKKICHSKEENKFKKIDDISYKNKEYNQKSFNLKSQKYNVFANSLTKIIPFLKTMKNLKKNTLKRNSPKNIVCKKSITLTNNSNSILVNKTNINLNNKSKLNLKIGLIKQKHKLSSFKCLKANKNNSLILEIPTSSNSNLLNQAKLNNKKNLVNMHIKPLNLKGIINENINTNTYKSLTMREEQNKNKIMKEIKDELLKNNIKNKEERNDINIIKKVSPNKNFINNDAIFDLSPFKIKDILLNQLPKNNISIKQKSSKSNYFIFQCIKGLLKIMIELLMIKGNNSIFIQMKFFSGNQNEYKAIRSQILGIIKNFKNSIQ